MCATLGRALELTTAESNSTYKKEEGLDVVSERLNRWILPLLSNLCVHCVEVPIVLGNSPCWDRVDLAMSTSSYSKNSLTNWTERTASEHPPDAALLLQARTPWDTTGPQADSLRSAGLGSVHQAR